MKEYRLNTILMLIMLSVAEVCFSQIDRIEYGLQGGVGVYIMNGKDNPIRTSMGFYDKEHEAAYSNVFPVMEQYGAFVRYRFDNHWNVTVEATRQRVRFREESAGSVKYYYNAMWHIDAVAEYNILSYGKTYDWGAELEDYPATPYLMIGLGVTAYNKDAACSMRSMSESSVARKHNMYPNMLNRYDLDAEGEYNQVKQRPTGALYLPVGLGVKWRLTSSLQLQASAKYHLYLVNGNLEGGTPEWTYEQMIDNKEHLKLGRTHDILISFGIVYNFSRHSLHHKHCSTIKWENS